MDQFTSCMKNYRFCRNILGIDPFSCCHYRCQVAWLTALMMFLRRCCPPPPPPPVGTDPSHWRLSRSQQSSRVLSATADRYTPIPCSRRRCYEAAVCCRSDSERSWRHRSWPRRETTGTRHRSRHLPPLEPEESEIRSHENHWDKAPEPPSAATGTRGVGGQVTPGHTGITGIRDWSRRLPPLEPEESEVRSPQVTRESLQDQGPKPPSAVTGTKAVRGQVIPGHTEITAGPGTEAAVCRHWNQSSQRSGHPRSHGNHCRIRDRSRRLPLLKPEALEVRSLQVTRESLGSGTEKWVLFKKKVVTWSQRPIMRRSHAKF